VSFNGAQFDPRSAGPPRAFLNPDFTILKVNQASVQCHSGLIVDDSFQTPQLDYSLVNHGETKQTMANGQTSQRGVVPSQMLSLLPAGGLLPIEDRTNSQKGLPVLLVNLDLCFVVY